MIELDDATTSQSSRADGQRLPCQRSSAALATERVSHERAIPPHMSDDGGSRARHPKVVSCRLVSHSRDQRRRCDSPGPNEGQQLWP
jgi:hypothetical protein